MSKVAELMYDIEQLYIDGLSARQIAVELNCPTDMVLDAIQSMGVEDVDAFAQGEAVMAWTTQQIMNVAFVPQIEEIYSPYNG